MNEYDYLAKAKKSMDKEKYHEVISLCNKAWKGITAFDKNTDFKLIEACYYRGYAKYKLGKHEEAQEDYETVNKVWKFDDYETYDKPLSD